MTHAHAWNCSEYDLERSVRNLEEVRDATKHAYEGIDLLMAIAALLKDGKATGCDSCYESTKTVIISSLETFFHYDGLATKSAIEILEAPEWHCPIHDRQ